MSFVSTISSGSYKGYQSSDSNQDGLIFVTSGNATSGPLQSALSLDGNYFAQIWTDDLYIYSNNNGIFTLQQTFTNANVTGGTFCFNENGNRFVYGKVGNSALVYSRAGNTWSLEQTLTPSDALSNYFASSTTINSSGNTILIGDSAFGTASTDKGNVYYYSQTSNIWTEEQKFQPANVANSEFFGASVSLNQYGNIAVIAASGNNSVNGGVYFFTRAGNTWSQQQKISGKPRLVRISDDGLSALSQTLGNTGSTTTYKFSGNTWATINSLTKPDTDWNTAGACINADGNLITVGYWKTGNIATIIKYQYSSNSYTQKTRTNIPNGQQVTQVFYSNDDGNLIALQYNPSSSNNINYWSVLQLT